MDERFNLSKPRDAGGSGGLAVLLFARTVAAVDERLATLLDDLRRAESLSAADQQRCARRANWFSEFSTSQFGAFLAEVGKLPLPLASVADSLLAVWLTAAVHARRQAAKGLATTYAGDPMLTTIESLYRGLGQSSHARGQLLAWLASGDQPAELQLLSKLLIDDPPQSEQDIVQAFAPLFQRRSQHAAPLFPRLLDALSSPLLAAPVLDLANFLTREKIVEQHPARDRADELIALLGELAQSLSSLEEQPQARGDSPQELSRRVSQGVALAVSLCDALAQIGDRRAIGKLYQALGVRHRRLRTEAAAALAGLGEEQGAAELVALAAEPVARLRVLAYAQELGISDRIEAQYATPVARAEAELCVWLAEPTQYGVPPTACELFDQRKQRWPGFDEPVDCYLFQFQYVLTLDEGERSYSNIGIAGPLVHAFVADLGDLPPDDIYAAFAGWQAQHEDIREFDVARLSQSEKLEAERLKRRLHDAGFTRIEPQRMGYFFGDKALVTTAEREGVTGVAIADMEGTLFFPNKHRRRPLGTEEAYCIYKGRRLLKTFNV